MEMYSRTKLIPNEFTTLILKARGTRRGALGLGVPLTPLAAEPTRLGTMTPAVASRTTA